MNFSQIEDAFFFVADASYGEHLVMICKTTDQICYQSEMTDLDEIPAEAYGSDAWVAVPHKNDLGLGRDLVFEFAAEHLPSDYDRVQMIFRKRGA